MEVTKSTNNLDSSVNNLTKSLSGENVIASSAVSSSHLSSKRIREKFLDQAKSTSHLKTVVTTVYKSVESVQTLVEKHDKKLDMLCAFLGFAPPSSSVDS